MHLEPAGMPTAGVGVGDGVGEGDGSALSLPSALVLAGHLHCEAGHWDTPSTSGIAHMATHLVNG